MCGSIAMKSAPVTSLASSTAEVAAARRVGSMVSSVILLRGVLQVLPTLGDILSNTQSALLQTISHTFGMEEFQNLVIEVDKQCFAVRAGADSLLDISRSSFCRSTEGVHELADKLRAEYPTLEGMKLHQTQVLVLHNLSVKLGAVVADPKGHTGLTAARYLKLVAFNTRLRDAANDCMLLTERRLLDNISLLDMIASFAEVVKLAPPGAFVRPVLQETGPLAIKQETGP
eukprot:gene8492-4853_t